MASYKIIWKTSAEKDIRKIDRAKIPVIINVIESLETEPFPSGHCKLKGAEKTYRIRSGDYRIIYQADTNNKTITVIYIRHRRDIYRSKSR